MKADLPIVYRKGAAFYAAFPYPMSAIRPLMPHPMLAPVSLGLGNGALIVAVFDHEDTSIGPHREVALGFQCRLRRSGPLPLLPLLAERFFDDVGPWLQLHPASTQSASDAGRSHWGFPRLVADIQIERTDDRVACEVTENGQTLMHVEIERAGRPAPMALPLRLYSTLEEELLLTELHIDAVGAIRRFRARAKLELMDHPRVREFDRHALAHARPIEVRWFDEYRTLLDRPSVRYRMSA
jgi:hypothetical protein